MSIHFFASDFILNAAESSGFNKQKNDKLALSIFSIKHFGNPKLDFNINSNFCMK